MGETSVPQHSLSEAPAPRDTPAPQIAIRTAAEPSSKISWDAGALDNPKMPTSLPNPPLPNPSITLKSAQDEPTKSWNTRKLGLRIGIDALSAGAAAVLIAPIITMIDKGIMENASGKNTLKESLKKSVRELALRPHRFLGSKPFALVFSLYSGTYFTANAIDTTMSTIHSTPLTTTTAGTPKFLATSTTNLALCLYKDNRFTQLFGSTSGPARPVPLATFALFTVRDCLTIFASFNLPPLLAPTLASHMSAETQRYVSAASAAQFLTPAAVQVFSTPLHLLGLDLYNRPGAGFGGVDGRAARVLRDWGMSALARMGRIIPAFGVGGVVNTKVRRGCMEGLEG